MRFVIMKQLQKKKNRVKLKNKVIKKKTDNEIAIKARDFITVCQMTKPVKTRGNENTNISQYHNQRRFIFTHLSNVPLLRCVYLLGWRFRNVLLHGPAHNL